MPLRNGRDPPSGRCSLGLVRGTQVGCTSVPHTILPQPQHISMGPQHTVTMSNTRSQVHVEGQLLPKASTAWTLPSGATFPLIPWTSHHQATASHDKQPALFPERQGAASADSPWENPSGACVFISQPGWGLNSRRHSVQNEHGRRPTWMWGPGILEEDAIQPFVPSPWQSSQAHLKIKGWPGLPLTFTANTESWDTPLIK